eukprot:TRINITY_DN6023_c0_g4_i1.p1 TRINITY_DN6023_c0_g4~~TRINITY_DN6023_c0_g4_i1.p1  ORF type:complete len:183 (-),score=29.27 TRINITY_DN6023_c0_g4_i1:168-716(-)
MKKYERRFEESKSTVMQNVIRQATRFRKQVWSAKRPEENSAKNKRDSAWRVLLLTGKQTHCRTDRKEGMRNTRLMNEGRKGVERKMGNVTTVMNKFFVKYSIMTAQTLSNAVAKIGEVLNELANKYLADIMKDTIERLKNYLSKDLADANNKQEAANANIISKNGKSDKFKVDGEIFNLNNE